MQERLVEFDGGYTMYGSGVLPDFKTGKYFSITLTPFVLENSHAMIDCEEAVCCTAHLAR